MGYGTIRSEFKKVDGLLYWGFAFLGMYVDMWAGKSEAFEKYGFILLLLAGLVISWAIERMQHNANVRALLVAGKLEVNKVEGKYGFKLKEGV